MSPVVEYWTEKYQSTVLPLPLALGDVYFVILFLFYGFVSASFSFHSISPAMLFLLTLGEVTDNVTIC